ncbi:MAG: hypothetical protein CMP67_10355 [Flavobacteriales bacterium]|nr:hypothetical protein [Flavobacteriales bacterium]
MLIGNQNTCLLFLLILMVVSCSSEIEEKVPDEFDVKDSIGVVKSQLKPAELKTIVGAESISEYLPLLENKRVAVVGNQTSIVGSSFLVDTLISLGVNLTLLFSPEHGFRGNYDAGEKVKHTQDSVTGLQIFSLHGKTHKPTAKSLENVDVILFDIQDVGVRFYTYISTLHYVMEAAAENNKQVIVLDRPNPNAHYIDGPILKKEFKSFVGMHPVPVVYGMTIGEYANMINGEFWLKDSLQVDLKVIKLKNWTHDKEYILPIPPSPNLPNQLSIYLYPSLCFFEGTEVSIGRGTEYPFQVWGHPNTTCKEQSNFTFTPMSIPGKSKKPKHQNKICKGIDYRGFERDSIRKNWKLEIGPIQQAKSCVQPRKTFFVRTRFFNLLAGNDEFIKQLEEKQNEADIRKSWESDLEKFKLIRSSYLLYK